MLSWILHHTSSSSHGYIHNCWRTLDFLRASMYPVDDIHFSLERFLEDEIGGIRYASLSYTTAITIPFRNASIRPIPILKWVYQPACCYWNISVSSNSTQIQLWMIPYEISRMMNRWYCISHYGPLRFSLQYHTAGWYSWNRRKGSNLLDIGKRIAYQSFCLLVMPLLCDQWKQLGTGTSPYSVRFGGMIVSLLRSVRHMLYWAIFWISCRFLLIQAIFTYGIDSQLRCKGD